MKLPSRLNSQDLTDDQLTLVLVMAWHHQAYYSQLPNWTQHWRQFHKRCLSHPYLKLAWKLLIKNATQISQSQWVNTLRPRQNGRCLADDTFKRIFFNENVRISIKISLKFVPKGPINNNPALVHIMAWRWSGDKPLSEPIMISLMTHICITRPQWVNAKGFSLPKYTPSSVPSCVIT